LKIAGKKGGGGKGEKKGGEILAFVKSPFRFCPPL